MNSKSYLVALIFSAVAGIQPIALASAELSQSLGNRRPNLNIIAPAVISTASQCAKLKSVGYKTVEFAPGRTMKLWYPTTGVETLKTTAGKLQSSLVSDGPLSQCKFPMVVFSHGYKGCSTQSLFITEALARAGYVVAAPNHLDSECENSTNELPVQESFDKPEDWSPETYIDRRNDLRAVLDLLLSSAYPNFVNPSRIGLVGHSLGGYTALGASGAWTSWSDSRVKAALLLSPYSSPFLSSNTLAGIQVPTMYQGGTLDLGVTPYVKKVGGVYDSSPSPKYFMELKKAAHFAWTNAICGNETKIAKCVAKSSNARLILSYGIGFLDEYVAGRAARVLKKKNPQLKDYRYDLGTSGIK